MANPSERKETRLVARTTAEIQETIQRAADYSGATVSQFLIESAVVRAREVIEQTETLQLTMAGTDALVRAMANPPKASPKLLRAAKQYRKEVDSSDY